MPAWRRSRAVAFLLAHLSLGTAACGDSAIAVLDAAPPSETPAPDAALASNGGDGGPAPSSEAGVLEPDAPSPSEILARLPKADDTRPFYLSQAGLYRDIKQKSLASGAVEFQPAFPLWSDGSEKQRWLLLPRGAQIDTQDPSAWHFPVGALAFKEFRAGARRLETRLVARIGEGADDFWFGAFVWKDDESDALFVPKGATNVRGTQHDVPEVKACGTCHRGDPARFLGLSIVQRVVLPAALVSTAQGQPFNPPGNAVEAAALGYMHGNCAHCHNPSGSARPDTDLDLRLRPSDRDVRETLAYRSSVNVPLQYFDAAPGARRLVPGDPTNSAILLRMRERGSRTQMPPLGSETTDALGLAAVQRWIEQLAAP